MALGKEEIRNRFGYHQGNGLTVPLHERVREAYIALAEYLDEILPDGRGKSLAFTELQVSAMWSNFGIAEQAPLVDTVKDGAQVRASLADSSVVKKPGPRPTRAAPRSRRASGGRSVGRASYRPFREELRGIDGVEK